MGNFEQDTRVQPIDGGYRADISPDWAIWGPNGGYLSAIALRAAGDAAMIKRPATFHAHYLRAARFEAARLTVDVIHRGVRSESIRVSLLQNEKLVLEGVLRTATLAEGLAYDESSDDLTRSQALDPESLPAIDDSFDPFRDRMTFWKNFDRRMSHPDYFSERRRSERATSDGWLRYRSEGPFTDPFVDAARSLVILDTCMWPCVYRKYGPTKFVAPSLDLTVMFHRGSPESAWLRYEMQAPVATGGLIAGQGRIFDVSGRTLASGSSQLMCMPAP